MLRLGLQRFSFLLKKERQLPFLSQRLGCNIQTKYFMSTAKYGSEFNDKLLSGKYYEVLGYPQGTDPNALTDS
jgi:hypothetical protein